MWASKQLLRKAIEASVQVQATSESGIWRKVQIPRAEAVLPFASLFPLYTHLTVFLFSTALIRFSPFTSFYSFLLLYTKHHSHASTMASQPINQEDIHGWIGRLNAVIAKPDTITAPAPASARPWHNGFFECFMPVDLCKSCSSLAKIAR